MATPKTIIRSDVLGLIGDSISSGFGASAGWMFNFMPAIKAAPCGILPAGNSDRQPVGYQAQMFPSFLMDAVPGRKVGDISGTMATVLAPFIAARTTVYIFQMGVNDAAALVPAATFATQVTAVRDAIVAAPFFKMLVWIGPWASFENWPDGANVVDTVLDGIKDKDTQIPAILSAVANTYYISWRTLRINTLNATTNPGHATTGIYTSDGAHPTTAPTSPQILSGDNLLSNYVIPLLTFQ